MEVETKNANQTLQILFDFYSSDPNPKSSESSKAQLNAEIQSGTFQLRKTNGIQNDCSAPRF